jgi:uncharacterized protein (TIGR02284 family)
MTDNTEKLMSLHTMLVDSRNGYDEALHDAEGKGLTPLFKELIAMRDREISDVATLIQCAGLVADPSGTFMSTVHRTVISIRSMLTGLGDNILPGLIDGEERVLKGYDEAISASRLEMDYSAIDILQRHRNSLATKIADMSSMNARAQADQS